LNGLDSDSDEKWQKGAWHFFVVGARGVSCSSLEDCPVRVVYSVSPRRTVVRRQAEAGGSGDNDGDRKKREKGKVKKEKREE
jgi:hypothetical protein